jgi:hypothetical protein
MASGSVYIQRFVDQIDRKLRADELSPKTMRVSTRSRLDVVLDKCGFAKRGTRNMAQIQEALWARGVYPSVDLTDPDLAFDETIYFTRRPLDVDGQRRLRFPAHLGLQQFPVENFELLFPTLRLKDTEYELSKGHRIDILARDRETSEWVVIELKPDVADCGVVAQIVGYMAEVAAAPPSKRGQSGVRGIVIAGRSDAVLQDQVQALARAEGFQVEWITYRVEMVLEPTRGSELTSPSAAL